MRFLKKDSLAIDGGELKYVCRQGDLSLLLEDLNEVSYQWDMGVGLSEKLVLKSEAQTIVLDPSTEGVYEVLRGLSKSLEGFPKVTDLSSLIEDDIAWDNVSLWNRI